MGCVSLDSFVLDFLDDALPRSAFRAPAQPLGRNEPTLLTLEDDLWITHIPYDLRRRIIGADVEKLTIAALPMHYRPPCAVLEEARKQGAGYLAACVHVARRLFWILAAGWGYYIAVWGVNTDRIKTASFTGHEIVRRMGIV